MAGVTGAVVRGRFRDDSSSRKTRGAGGGGGAIRTSGRGSGDTDSLEEFSRLIGYWIGVLVRELWQPPVGVWTVYSEGGSDIPLGGIVKVLGFFR